MRRARRKVQLSFGRVDDDLKLIMVTGTRQQTLPRTLYKTRPRAEGPMACCWHCLREDCPKRPYINECDRHAQLHKYGCPSLMREPEEGANDEK